jgi:FtsH-binding integral membrane protein
MFDKAIMSRLSRNAGMSLRKANQLTLSGFCAFYTGLMGMLMAINVPVISGFRRPVVLVLSAIALAGVALMLIGRLTKADESEGF